MSQDHPRLLFKVLVLVQGDLEQDRQMTAIAKEENAFCLTLYLLSATSTRFGQVDSSNC